MKNNITVIRLTFYLLVVAFKHKNIYVPLATNCLIDSWLDNWKKKVLVRNLFSKGKYLELGNRYN